MSENEMMMGAEEAVAGAMPPPGDFGATIKKILTYYKPYKAVMIIAMLFAVISSAMSVISPKVVSKMINVIQKGIFAEMDKHRFISYVWILILLYTAGAVLSAVQRIIMTVVTQRVTKQFRGDLSGKINRLPMSYFHATQVGDILSRVTNDVDLIGSELSTSAVNIVSSLTLLITVLVMMFTASILLTLTVILSSILGLVLIALIMMRSQRFFEEQQNNLGSINGYIEEIFDNNLIIKAFNKQDDVKSKFNAYNDRLRKNNYMASCFSGLLNPLMTFIGNLGYVAVCVVGAMLAFKGKIEFGSIIEFIMYAQLFMQPLSIFGQVGQILQLSSAAGQRVFEVLEEEEMPYENSSSGKLSRVRGEVVFDNVQFGYIKDADPVIKGFSARVLPGQKVAIVGPTGAGKTTLLNLLLRFYDIQGGDITIDGYSIKELTRSEIREQFGMILQDTWLFNGTILENLVYTTPNVSQSKVDRVCRAVQLDYFIRNLPDGYDTVIDANTELSAGQRQQIAIARAMIADRSMIMLDEATSSVDTRLELVIQNAMDELMKGRTSFVIAHRLSTIKNADLILVLIDGDIVESGTHDELLSIDGFYRRLYRSQYESA